MRSLLAVILWLALTVAPLAAQNPAPPAPVPPGEAKSESSSPMPWVIAVICTLVILLIVCMPSRKGQT